MTYERVKKNDIEKSQSKKKRNFLKKFFFSKSKTNK